MQNNNIDDIYYKTIHSLNVSVEKVFIENIRKGTITLLVKTSKDEFNVLKIKKNNSPQKTHQEFEHEKKYYFDVENDLSPSLIKAGDNFLLIEYIDSKTLRSKIVDLSRCNRLNINILQDGITKIFKHYNSILTTSNNQFYDVDKASSELMGLFIKLSDSGPFNSSRSLWNKNICYYQRKLSTSRVKEMISKIFSENKEILVMGTTHGDLHLDNIIVDKENDFLFVDYANWQMDGLVIKDLIYFLSTLFSILSFNQVKKNKLIELCNDIICEVNSDLKVIMQISILFHYMGSMNGRFNQMSSEFDLVKKYLGYPFKVYKFNT